MKKIRLSELKDVTEGHILKDVLPGKRIIVGGLAFDEPGEDHHLISGDDQPLAVLWCHAGEN